MSKNGHKPKCEICWQGSNVQYSSKGGCWACNNCRSDFELDAPKTYAVTNGAFQAALPTTKQPTYQAPIRQCAHHRTPFQFNEHTVYLSGSTDRKTPAQGPKASAAVYLASDWIRGTVLANEGMRRPEGEPWIVYLDWPDYGAVKLDRLIPVAKWALKQLEEGATLEIGCQGGHGRTGTFVAAVMVLTGWHPNDAMDEVRASYCKKAIESKKQEDLLGELYDALEREDTKENSH